MNGSNLLPIINGAGGYSFLRSSDGFGMYRAGQNNSDAKEKFITVDSVAYIFETGEIWSVDTALLSFDRRNLPFIERYFTESLERYTKLLQSLELDFPYQWIAGISGIKGRHLQYPTQPGYSRIGPGPISTSDTIEVEGEYNEEQSTTESLLPFFKEIFNKCGLSRPDYLSK
jgi:hypothetical protein